MPRRSGNALTDGFTVTAERPVTAAPGNFMSASDAEEYDEDSRQMGEVFGQRALNRRHYKDPVEDDRVKYRSR